MHGYCLAILCENEIGGAPLADDLRRIESVLKILKRPDQLAVDRKRPV